MRTQVRGAAEVLDGMSPGWWGARPDDDVCPSSAAVVRRAPDSSVVTKALWYDSELPPGDGGSDHLHAPPRPPLPCRFPSRLLPVRGGRHAVPLRSRRRADGRRPCRVHPRDAAGPRAIHAFPTAVRATRKKPLAFLVDGNGESPRPSAAPSAARDHRLAAGSSITAPRPPWEKKERLLWANRAPSPWR
ncbi:hypothetical protein E2562_035020 [Oryza meyeriana var. granulata]|uniref:Uncharacterized protein n=1 Tax=Oryza meyeriana var. granulata TaxID=110450 RepID=A0A6G1F1K1_9ORYZ|nr:hypothetical protein E2562_035020 [Oryza meyeriana var. granulata]